MESAEVQMEESREESKMEGQSLEKDNISVMINENDVTFKISFNKKLYDVTWDKSKTISSLKEHVHPLTEVPPQMQKLMFKGLLKDTQTLSEAKIVNGTKVMLIGSKLTDVITANSKTSSSSTNNSETIVDEKEHISMQKPHSKIIQQGVPDDAMPAYKNGHEPLPDIPLFGMLNKAGHKVRLTFKLECDQVWIGTKERTEKVQMNSIKQVISEPVKNKEEYHMMALQLGPTEQSRYWIYWVPAQYVNSIKETILGGLQFF